MTDCDAPIETSWLDRPPRVTSSSTLRDVAAAMEDSKISCAMVGMDAPWLVTDHDLAGALVAGLAPDTPVERVAVKAPIWATESTELLEAVGMMINDGIRHLLVLAPTGEVLGVLSVTTAIRLLLDKRELPNRVKPLRLATAQRIESKAP